MLKDEASLPQLSPSYHAFDPSHCSLEKTQIIVSTTLALLPNQKSVFQRTGHSQTQLPGDNHNIREYVFDGKSLRLVAEEQTDTPCLVSNFSSDGKTFAVIKGTSGQTVGIPSNLFYASFFKATRDCKDGKFIPLDGTITTTGLPSFNFSLDGKWIIVAGENNVSGFSNVNLYKVESDFKKFKCPKKCSKQ